MKILVAVDGSKCALNAVKYSIDLIGKLASKDSTVSLISVHDDAGLRHARAYVGRDAIDDYLRELSEKDLKESQALLDAANVKHDMVVRTGTASLEIVACAKAGHYDQIVLGAKGRNAIADLLLGSVAQRVLAVAPMPVVLVK